MKTETEILGELDALLSQLDDAARERAFAWLKAKHAAKPAVKVAPMPTVNPPQPAPYIPPGIIGPWPAPPDPQPLKITWVGHGGMCACPQCVPPVWGNTITVYGNWPNASCAPNIYPQWTWTGETSGYLANGNVSTVQ